MCRLLLGTKNALKCYNKAYKLDALLKHLVKECGGHGNGIALIKDKSIVFTRKGVKYGHKEIAKVLLSQDYDYAIFHTRIASVSAISDTNCHPFIYQKRYAMAMNGTVFGLSGIASTIGITDTECIFNIVKGLDIETTVKALSTLSPVFIGCCEGLPYALKNHGDLASWTGKGMTESDYLFASSFPYIGVKGVQDLPKNFTWVNGEDRTPARLIFKASPSFAMYEKEETFTRDIPTLETIGGSPYQESYSDGYGVGYMDGYLDGSEGLEPNF